MRGVCITTYNGIIDLRVVLPRAAIDKLILLAPPVCACAFDVFVNVNVNDVIIYLSTGFPEKLNYPEIWVNRVPRGGHREIGGVAGFVPQQPPPRYDEIGFAPFIPPPPPPAQPQAPLPPQPEYEDITDNEVEAVANEVDAVVEAVVNEAVVVNETDTDGESLIIISDTEAEGVDEMVVDEEEEEEEEEENGIHVIVVVNDDVVVEEEEDCLLYTSPSPRDRQKSRMPSSA